MTTYTYSTTLHFNLLLFCFCFLFFHRLKWHSNFRHWASKAATGDALGRTTEFIHHSFTLRSFVRLFIHLNNFAVCVLLMWLTECRHCFTFDGLRSEPSSIHSFIHFTMDRGSNNSSANRLLWPHVWGSRRWSAFTCLQHIIKAVVCAFVYFHQMMAVIVGSF